ncbi:DUF2889 domain-containing protein [Inhella gelatinilytica]|uniref:DUF2889 domain-containing protein n=1 Tax=Inhella gelatinilytica TaxID=2795030 RepID=A0A931IXU8_9BURK|nr:DUF2889 domain-containing protein [Inhella gelatinilytica]MBH9551836.1 DUF2889 domain-containing protein [Inhella gelatinilytica]
MSASANPAERQLLHRRNLVLEVFERADGLFDVEARLLDVKARDMELASGRRPAGEPIHDMRLVLLIDRQMNVLSARSDTSAMPYPGACDAHSNAYAKLEGLNLFKGFRAGVKERLSGVQGCTHLTELAAQIPTAVLQAFAGTVIDVREGDADGSPPYQIDRCHALSSDGATVQAYYPRWYRPARSTA